MGRSTEMVANNIKVENNSRNTNALSRHIVSLQSTHA
jgi:hypothetical protein